MKEPREGAQKELLTRRLREWERQFWARCVKGRAATRALKRLEQAGLGGACRRLLWEYSEGQAYFAEVQRGMALIVRNLRAFDRAERVWKGKSDDPRAPLFRQRFEDAARVLMQTPWPFHNPAVRTFGDQYRLTPSADLFKLRKIRAMVGRSKLGYMLAMLRAGAGAHGVRLSGNELAALVYCATGQELYGTAVRRMIREPWIAAAESDFRAVFETYLASAE